MENKLENIDKYFRDNLEGFQEEPRAIVWENIAAKLGHKKKSRVVFFIMRIAAGMTIMLSLSTGYYFITHSGKKIQPHIIATQHNVKPIEKIIKSQQNQQVINIKNNKNQMAVKEPSNKAVAPVETTNKEQPVENSVTANDNNELTMLSSNVRKEEDLQILKGIQINNLPVRYDKGLAKITPSKVNNTANSDANTLAYLEELKDNTDNTVKKEKNWQLGGDFAPLYSYRTLSSDYFTSDQLKLLNENEEGVYAYSGGFNFSYSATRRLSFQSGIYYSRYGQEKKAVSSISYKNNGELANVPEGYTIVNVSFVNSTGTIIPDNTTAATMYYNSKQDVTFGNYPSTTSGNPIGIGYTGGDYNSYMDVSNASAKQYFDYLELPFLLKYKVINKKLNFSLIGGLVTNYMVGNKILVTMDGETTQYGKTEKINKINCSSSLGLGIEYPVFSNVIFSIEPQFRYSLNSLDKSWKINVHPYSIGIFTGLRYKF